MSKWKERIPGIVISVILVAVFAVFMVILLQSKMVPTKLLILGGIALVLLVASAVLLVRSIRNKGQFICGASLSLVLAIDGEFIHNVNNGLERPKSCSFHCIKTCDYTKSPYCIIKALYNAARGNMKKGYAFAGSNAFLAEKISSVKEVMATLEREFFLATHRLA